MYAVYLDDDNDLADLLWKVIMISMSWGAISPDPAEGPYISTNKSLPSFDKNRLLQHRYINVNQFEDLQRVFEIAPEKYARISELIGMVVLRIQQMSFIPIKTAEKFAARFALEHRARTDLSAEQGTLLGVSEVGHVTTLSPDSLTQAIRHAVGQIMLAIGDEFLSDASRASVQVILEQLRVRLEMPEKDGLIFRVQTVLDTDDIERQWPARADFLSPEARTMLHALDPTLKPPVDLVAQRIAEYFSVRSELSRPSFSSDLMPPAFVDWDHDLGDMPTVSPARSRLSNVQPTHHSYSTLNPSDVIEMMDSYGTANILSPLIFCRMGAAVPASLRT